MIAVCPTCHDAIHHGAIRISDDTLYRWKTITRTDEANQGHLYVEPGRQAKLLLGSVSVTGDAGLIVFELSRGNHLSFALRDQDIVLLSLAVADRHGRELARLVENYVKPTPGTDVAYTQIPGRHTITAPMSRRYMPMWALTRVQANEPSYRPDERVTLLNLEVMEPGIVRVAGVWLEPRHGVVITDAAMHFVRVDPLVPRSLAIAGAGVDSTLHYTGPITNALFEFGGEGGAPNVAGDRDCHPIFRQVASHQTDSSVD
jgi:hypothetical protein